MYSVPTRQSMQASNSRNISTFTPQELKQLQRGCNRRSPREAQGPNVRDLIAEVEAINIFSDDEEMPDGDCDRETCTPVVPPL